MVPLVLLQLSTHTYLEIFLTRIIWKYVFLKKKKLTNSEDSRVKSEDLSKVTTYFMKKIGGKRYNQKSLDFMEHYS